MRKTRGDCRVGTFEKNMDYHREQSEIQMEEMQGAIRRYQHFVKIGIKENK